MAETYLAMGAWDKAEPMFRKALEIARGAVGRSHPSCVNILGGLARGLGAQERAGEAMAALDEAVWIEEEVIRRIFASSSELRRTAFIARSNFIYHGLVSLVIAHFPESETAIQRAFNAVMRRKAVGAEAVTAQRRAILSGRYPQLAESLRRLDVLCAQITQKLLAGPGLREAPEVYQRVLAEWFSERELLEAAVADKVPELRLERELGTANAQEIASKIGDGALLIEFCKFRKIDFKAVAARGEACQEERYAAFVLPGSRPNDIRLIDLGEAKRIDDLIVAFRAELVGTTGDAQLGMAYADELTDESPRTIHRGGSLRELLFERLNLPLDCRRLLLAADGELTRLSFESLPAGGGRFVGDEFEICYLVTGRDLLREGVPSTKAPSPPLLIADPDFDYFARPVRTEEKGAVVKWVDAIVSWISGSAQRREKTSYRFSRLPAMRVECEILARHLSGLALLGDEARKGRVRKVRSPAILHIATHGFFLENKLEEDAGSSFLDQSLDTFQRLSSIPMPMVRSGLALAGANAFLEHRKLMSDEVEDGLMTAEDVAKLDLLDTELVFLSACETGIGDVLAGEGVFGMRRAFAIAGARTLIMTLWKVSELATAVLVDRFYDVLLHGASKVTALRNAQQYLRTVTLGDLRPRWLTNQMRERFAGGDNGRRERLEALAAQPDDTQPFRHPYYWGAFILQGDRGPLRWDAVRF